jgi:hypothetical protein
MPKAKGGTGGSRKSRRNDEAPYYESGEINEEVLITTTGGGGGGGSGGGGGNNKKQPPQKSQRGNAKDRSNNGSDRDRTHRPDRDSLDNYRDNTTTTTNNNNNTRRSRNNKNNNNNNKDSIDKNDINTPCLTFDDMKLKDDLLKGIYAYGFEKPSAIQQRAIKPIVLGRDVIAQSQSVR